MQALRIIQLRAQLHLRSREGRTPDAFKGGRYRLVGYAKDSETLEPMCVYEALYDAGGLWVRPAKMFFENVDKPGYSGPRFRIAGE